METKMQDYKEKNSPMEEPTGDLSVTIISAETEDEQEFAEMAPSGKYTAENLNLLVAATNKLLPLFEQSPDYPTFEEAIDGELPTDFVRVLVMFLGAIDSAIEEDAIDPEMAYELEELIDDSSLLQLSGRLTALANNRDFRQFLKNPPPEKEEAEEELLPISPEESLMSNSDIDTLFASRV